LANVILLTMPPSNDVDPTCSQQQRFAIMVDDTIEMTVFANDVIRKLALRSWSRAVAIVMAMRSSLDGDSPSRRSPVSAIHLPIWRSCFRLHWFAIID
jgi:hypothetical protein